MNKMRLFQYLDVTKNYENLPTYCLHFVCTVAQTKESGNRMWEQAMWIVADYEKFQLIAMFPTIGEEIVDITAIALSQPLLMFRRSLPERAVVREESLNFPD